MRDPPRFSVKEQEEQVAKSPPSSPPAPSSLTGVAGAEDGTGEQEKGEPESSHAGQDGDSEEEETQEQQEVDWKADEEFKKFMSNPSIEAAIKLEKKRADRKLKELDQEMDGNPLSRLFRNAVRNRLAREKERLEKAEEAFKALDLNKVCFFPFSFLGYSSIRFEIAI